MAAKQLFRFTIVNRYRHPSPVPTNPSQLIDRARDHFKAKRHADGRNCLEELLSEDPGNQKAYQLLIRNSHSDLDLLKYFERAEDAGADNSYVTCAVIERLMRNRNAFSAKEVFFDRIREGKADTFVASTMLKACRDYDDKVSAREVFDASLDAGVADNHVFTIFLSFMGSMDPNLAAGYVKRIDFEMDIQLYTVVMGVLGRAGMVEEARAYFDEAKQHGLADARMFTSMIRTYLRANQYAKADALYNEAISERVADAELDRIIRYHQ